jgi:hypothetical protein
MALQLPGGPGAACESGARLQVFDEARARLKEEGRPLISRWTAMATNRAIRKARRRRRLAALSISILCIPHLRAPLLISGGAEVDCEPVAEEQGGRTLRPRRRPRRPRWGQEVGQEVEGGGRGGHGRGRAQTRAAPPFRLTPPLAESHPESPRPTAHGRCWRKVTAPPPPPSREEGGPLEQNPREDRAREGQEGVPRAGGGGAPRVAAGFTL